jgi:c-di-AMP phosphodiesterase-like protein
LLEDYNDTLSEMVRLTRESDGYNFVTGQEALALADKDSLLILVDFHRPQLALSRELLEKIDKVAIIDHHRKAADCVENPVLQYIEPYASSTSELVAEILGYVGERKNIDKLEAEVMLAGITMDTNRFSVKTGVRTFEAAAWLRKQGADTTEVKRFFQTEMKMFKIRVKCVSNATITKSGEAVTICEGIHNNAQIITAQIADELLSIKGVKVGFVAGKDAGGETIMSARSLGDVNVQVIMEKLGGGGHLTTAGAQLKGSPEDAIEKLMTVLREEE